MSYERIITDGGKPILLRVDSDAGGFIRGREITRSGNLTHRVHLIDKQAVKTRTEYVMDKHYGVLTLRR